MVYKKWGEFLEIPRLNKVRYKQTSWQNNWLGLYIHRDIERTWNLRAIIYIIIMCVFVVNKTLFMPHMLSIFIYVYYVYVIHTVMLYICNSIYVMHIFTSVFPIISHHHLLRTRSLQGCFFISLLFVFLISFFP